MKILLYGSNGLLGKEFIKMNNEKRKYEIFQGKNNITEMAIFEEIENFRPDIILNFAGLVKYKIDYAVNVFYSNVLGPINLSRQTMLFNQEYDKRVNVITIGSTCDNEIDSNIYAYSKKCLIGLVEHLSNLKIVRLPGIFSVKRKSGAVYNFYEKAVKNEKIVIDSKLNKWNCLYIESAIEAIYESLDYIMMSKITNIAYDELHNLESIALIIKKYLKSKSKIIVNRQPLKSKVSSAKGILSKDQIWIFPKNKLKKDLRLYVEKNLYNS